MDSKLKLATATSLVALATAACAPNPYWQYPGTATGTTATTTARPVYNNNAYYNPNYNRSNTVTTGRVVGGVTHTHCGRTHTHPLPPQGLAHDHGMSGCMAGSGGGAANNNSAYAYNQPANNAYYTPPVDNNVYYTPPATNNTTTGSTSYGYTGQGNPTYYNYGTPATGSNTGTNANTGYNSSSYYEYTAPKPSSNTSSSYTYTPPATTTTPPANTANTYVVKKGDTVFQVMRNTGVYWKDIIRLNNLQAPDYSIAPGQTLRLK